MDKRRTVGFYYDGAIVATRLDGISYARHVWNHTTWPSLGRFAALMPRMVESGWAMMEVRGGFVLVEHADPSSWLRQTRKEKEG